MASAPDVVITGLGATTPLGGDVDSTWKSALAGRSGVRTMDNDWAVKYEIPVAFAGTLAVPAADILTRPETRKMDPSAQYATIAAREAWAHAGSPDVAPERLGAVVGSGIGGVWTILSAWDTIREKGARRALPMTVPMLMPNSPAANISIEFGAKAGAHAPVSACASGAEAIAYGAQMIRSGRADVVIAGGTEAAVHPMPISSFAAMKALSTRNDDPAGASRPYDVTRDGFVLGEGAGIVILESAAHAAARGATVLAHVSGFGMTSDAHHIAAPEPTGVGQTGAMRTALADADLTARDVVHVNAHATSTPVGDMIEARGIRSLFGADADHVVLSATKSMMGHLLGAAGAVETILTVLALRDHVAPPTINVTQPDPQLDLDLVRDTPRALPAGPIAAINNSFGFGGHNVALVLTSA
ncbi:beta-ketoacyl-[acyl-carrier-protein] synthase family protein [Pengzhenrongella sicca]|uniref:Beta-ketoacyl-[acyl-carrier-protein] synthase family protein n=1 Tax=Pengzhenrongella sicca TaxID=2819238 RepID=A0A8A4ZFK3_9MICO|nr:beta-ketoacyl-[acyl-carrier-protein] synthase family protein [Pengzhenrongella sicca]QTE28448.1 beta-ketoacyl-[acyl-carrier-protein] synthase family protein [Pengzhenrongella sicca]